MLQPLHRVKILTPSGGMHIFPRKKCIPLGKIARHLGNSNEIYHFPVWRRKSGHVVRSRSHTCEKISTGGKKDLLALFGGNAAIQLWVEINGNWRDSPSYFAREQEFYVKLLKKCYGKSTTCKKWYDTQNIVRSRRGDRNQNFPRLNSLAACVLSKNS